MTRPRLTRIRSRTTISLAIDAGREKRDRARPARGRRNAKPLAGENRTPAHLSAHHSSGVMLGFPSFLAAGSWLGITKPARCRVHYVTDGGASSTP